MPRLFGRACPVPIRTFVEPPFLSQASLPTASPKRTSEAHFCNASSCACLGAIPAAPQAASVDDCPIQSKGATVGQNSTSPPRSFETLLPVLYQCGSTGFPVAKARRKNGSTSRRGRCCISGVSSHCCQPNGPHGPASRHVSQVSRQNSDYLSKKRCADRSLRVARDTLLSCPRHHFLPSCFSPPCLQLPPPPKPSSFHMFAICSILVVERESHGGMAAWVFTSRLEANRACC